MAKLAVQLQKIASNAQVQVQQLANEATEKSFQYNTQEANTARAWQKEMSDTAHQREVADLKKAGLNPVLSANSGAQSYTTSSASAQANDPSGSIGSLAAQQMSGIAQGYSADKSSSATRYAARVSAAATREAAAATASAARYAASMNYLNNRQHENWQNEYLKKSTEAKIRILNSTPTKSIGGVLDKLAQRAGLYDLVGTKRVNSVVNGMKNFLNSDPSKYFKNNGNITANNFKLNNAGKQFINNQLKLMGVKGSSVTRKLFVQAVIFRNPFAFNIFSRYVPRPIRSGATR